MIYGLPQSSEGDTDMKKRGANAVEQRRIAKLAGEGHDAKAISNAVGIVADVVANFMEAPKLPLKKEEPEKEPEAEPETKEA